MIAGRLVLHSKLGWPDWWARLIVPPLTENSISKDITENITDRQFYYVSCHPDRLIMLYLHTRAREQNMTALVRAETHHGPSVFISVAITGPRLQFMRLLHHWKNSHFIVFFFLPWKWANRPGIVTDVEMQENCKNKWAAVMKWSARIVVMCLHSDQAGTTWLVMVHCLLPPPPSPSHLVTVLPASSQC